MMWQQRVRLSNGFIPTQDPYDLIPDSIIDGLNMRPIGPGLYESFKGLTSSGVAGAPAAMLVADVSGGVTTGTIYDHRNADWFIGSGAAIKNGSSIGTATTSLQLRYASTTYTAGLTRPGAPTVHALDGTDGYPDVSGGMEGSYSVRVSRVRSATGAESTASPRSNVVNPRKKKIRVYLATADNGSDRSAVYVSRRGFGGTGVCYFYMELDLADYPDGYIDIDVSDGDLGGLAPLDFDPPFPGTHACAIGGVNIVVGGLGGHAVQPSIFGRPEQFPPDLVSFLAPGEPVIGLRGRPTDQWAYVWCANSVHVLIATSSSIAPVIARCLWAEVGIQSKNGACLVESELYGFSGQKGPVRTSQFSDPDTSFAYPVHTITEGWTAANVSVGYSAATNEVVFCHGSQAIAFHRSSGLWSTLLDLPGSAISAVSVGGVLKVNIGGTLYDWNVGSGSSWFILTPYYSCGYPGMDKTMWSLKVSGRGSMTVDVYGDELTTSLETLSFTDPGTGRGYHANWESKLNIKDHESFAIKVSGTGSGKRVDDIQFDGSVRAHHKT